MAEYKESEAYKENLADDRLEVTFNCLYHRLANDYPSMDLSCYTLAVLLEVHALEDDVHFVCPTPDPSIVHSPQALPIIHEDRPFEVFEAEARAEVDTFTEELNEVLTFDGGVPREGKITAALADP